jgi:GST-like protein
MFDFYYQPTPDCWKVAILLEELGLSYRLCPTAGPTGAVSLAALGAISPDGTLPALLDHEGPKGRPYGLFQSGAILLYLGEREGQLIGTTPSERYEVLQWLMWQTGGVGPMFEEAHHFTRHAPAPVPYAIKRYENEARRLLGVLDRRLAARAFVAGRYSIADIAIFGWLKEHRHDHAVDDFAAVAGWYAALKARPAVRRGCALGVPLRQAGEAVSA